MVCIAFLTNRQAFAALGLALSGCSISRLWRDGIFYDRVPGSQKIKNHNNWSKLLKAHLAFEEPSEYLKFNILVKDSCQSTMFDTKHCATFHMYGTYFWYTSEGPFCSTYFFKHKNCHLTLCSCNLITDYYLFFRKPICVSLPVHRPLHSWVTFLLFSSSCSGMPFIRVVCSQSSFVAHFGMSLAHLRSCTGFFSKFVTPFQDVYWIFSQLLAFFFFILK